MSTIRLKLPDSLHKKVKQLVKEDNTSINQFISSAVTEKISALLTQEYLAELARRGSKEKFRKALSKVADVEPVESDEFIDK